MLWFTLPLKFVKYLEVFIYTHYNVPLSALTGTKGVSLLFFGYFPWTSLNNLSKSEKRDFTQQTLADTVGLHVNQIKCYEAGSAQPTLDTLARLAKELHTTLDELVFGKAERGSIDKLKLQFEALSYFDEEERKVTKILLESLILKHKAKRAFMDN